MALNNKKPKNLQNSLRPDKGRGNVSGPGIARTGAVTLLRKNKPKASKIGGAKGEWRRVDGGWKRRRFTAKQRQLFRARKDGPKLGSSR